MEILPTKPLNQVDLSIAIAPNIFEAYLNPDLLLSLVLGNLLSSRLWDLSARITQKLKNNQQTTGGTSEAQPAQLAFIRAIQKEIDRNFTHLHQSEVSAIYGELSLTNEAIRLGQQNIDQAVSELKNFYGRNSLNLPDQVNETLASVLEQDKFPAFYYANFDVIRAHRFLKGSRHTPMGLTSCLDEIAIFSALAMTLSPGIVANVIALSCLTHYTAFGWNETGESWWFYGKNKFFTQSDWKLHVEQEFNGDAQLAFNHKFRDFNRITSVAGTFNLKNGNTSIAAAHIDELVDKLDQFFGCRLEQLDEGLMQPRGTMPEASIAPILRELLGTQAIEHARARLLNSDEGACKQALYSYRSLQVKDFLPYLQVARNNPNCKNIGSTLKSLQDAVEVVMSLEGKVSIFEDRNRLAMPDETLRLRTGSDIDLALLLHVLVEHFLAATNNKSATFTLVTDADSFVCSGDFCFSLGTMTMTNPPTAGIVMTFSDSAAR